MLQPEPWRRCTVPAKAVQGGTVNSGGDRMASAARQRGWSPEPKLTEVCLACPTLPWAEVLLQDISLCLLLGHLWVWNWGWKESEVVGDVEHDKLPDMSLNPGFH